MIYRTRKMVKPEDLNPRNTLFGGRVLQWVDEECAVFAMCQLNTSNLVTKIISECDFVAQAKQGDIVEIGVETVQFGTTSITLRCEVRNKNTKHTILKIDKVVMVCVDELGKPKAHGVIQEKEDDSVIASKLLNFCRDFIKEQEIRCSETVYQTDRVIENAYSFIEDICNVVGYHEEEN